MKWKEEYAEFNSFYYQCLDRVKENARNNPGGHDAEFLKSCIEKDAHLTTTIYKKFIDDYETVEVGPKKYQLLPMGVINDNISNHFIDKSYAGVTGHFSINQLRRGVLEEPNFRLFYYPNYTKKLDNTTLRRICESYKKHYRENLKEIWSDEDFYKMISDLNYLSVKYATDEETGETFAIGFFGTYVRSGAGGKALTNAELYVMPEFRHHGIAKKMVSLTFELAKGDKIENFDSITYRVLGHDALAFWQGIGASISGLYHIEGSISEMLKQMNQEKRI